MVFNGATIPIYDFPRMAFQFLGFQVAGFGFACFQVAAFGFACFQEAAFYFRSLRERQLNLRLFKGTTIWKLGFVESQTLCEKSIFHNHTICQTLLNFFPHSDIF